MIRPGSVAAVFRFEWRRALTVPRMAWWLGLACFPVLLVWLVKTGLREVPELPPPQVVRVDLNGLAGGAPTSITIDGEEITDDPMGHLVRLAGEINMGPQPQPVPQVPPVREGNVPPEVDDENTGDTDPDAMDQGANPVDVDPDQPADVAFSQAEPPGQPGQPVEYRVERRGPRFAPILIIRHDLKISKGVETTLKGYLQRRGYTNVLFHRVGEPEPEFEIRQPRVVVLAAAMFILVPTVVCMLGVFLGAAPAVASELERRSWIYLAVRPDGPASMLVGKYLVAVTWAASAALAGLTASVLVAQPAGGVFEFWWPLAGLIVLACPAYAAIYTLIGVIMPRRAMVLAVVYSLVLEGAVSWFPAIINRVTVQFRLRSLYSHWMGLGDGPTNEFVEFYGFENASPVWHVGCLLTISLLGLAAAVLLLRWKELSQADESET